MTSRICLVWVGNEPGIRELATEPMVTGVTMLPAAVTSRICLV